MIPEKKPRKGKPFSSDAGILEINAKRYAAEKGIAIYDTIHQEPGLKFIRPNIYILFGEWNYKTIGPAWLMKQDEHWFIRIGDFERFAFH